MMLKRVFRALGRRSSRAVRIVPDRAAERLEARVLFSTFTVSNLADSGPGSLRQAVADANSNPGDDSVTFAMGLTGTINLTGGQLFITDNLTVIGPGSGALTIDGNDDSRAFFVESGVNATINDLTITHGGSGSNGGAIVNLGNVVAINRCVFTANQSADTAGAIGNSNPQGTSLTITDCTFVSNDSMTGGAIFNTGHLLIQNSTFSTNTAEFGGALSNGGTLGIVGCTFSNNQAFQGGGGALLNEGSATASDSTFAGNSAFNQGSDVFNTGTADITDCNVGQATSSVFATSTAVSTTFHGTITAAFLTFVPPSGTTAPASSLSTKRVAPVTPLLTVKPDTTLNSGAVAFAAAGMIDIDPGAVLQVGDGGIAFGSSGGTIAIASDDSAPGALLLGGDVTSTDPAGETSIRSTGTGGAPGYIDLGGATRSFTLGRASGGPDLSVSAQITDGALRTAGAGRLQLSAANTYAGGTTIAGGTLEADHSNATGTGPITFAGGILALDPGVTLANPISAAPTDTMRLDVGAAAVQLTSAAPGAALDVVGAAGGSLTINGPLALRHDLVVNNAVPVTLEGALSGSFALTKTGTAALVLAGAAPNTYGGATEVAGGTLELDKSAGVALPGALTIDGNATVRADAPGQFPQERAAAVTLDGESGTATLDLSAAPGATTLGSLTINGSGHVLLGANALHIAKATLATIMTYVNDGQITAGGSKPIASENGGVITVTPAPPPLPGDANGDGKVDFADLLILAQNYGKSGATFAQGDFNGDALVSFPDLLILAQHYAQSRLPAAPTRSR